MTTEIGTDKNTRPAGGGAAVGHATGQARSPTYSTTGTITPSTLQRDLVTGLLTGFLDLRLLVNQTCGRVEQVVLSTASKADLDGIERRLGRIEAALERLLHLHEDHAAMRADRKRIPIASGGRP